MAEHKKMLAHLHTINTLIVMLETSKIKNKKEQVGIIWAKIPTTETTKIKEITRRTNKQ